MNYQNELLSIANNYIKKNNLENIKSFAKDKILRRV